MPVSKPSIGREELEAVERVFNSAWLGMGSKVFEFEEALKGYLGSKYLIAVNTGTTALHVALDACGIGIGDEVIVPSLTFCATIQAITALGATPVFCEVAPENLNMVVADVISRITPKTKAIIPVHYCGNPCDMDQLLSIGRGCRIRIIEDAAHAFGSSYKGRKIGSFGDITCFSFDPIKNITCGEGGAVAVNDAELAEEIRRKRILGIDKDTWHRYRNERSWFYEVTTQGYRYHLSNINAAIGLVQLKKLEEFLLKKRTIVASYQRSFADLPGLALLEWNIEETAPFTYIVRVCNGRRDEAMEFLERREIGTGVHYVPNHIQPYFAKYAGQLPVTDRLWREIMTLPLYYDMSEGDVAHVISSVKEFFERDS